MARALAGYFCSLLLLACGQSERNPADEMSASHSGVGGEVAVPSTEQGGSSGGVLLSEGGAPTAPAPSDDPCLCAGDGFGAKVTLGDGDGDETQTLAVNLAPPARCGPALPAHARVVSGCGDDVSLALGVDAAGAGPRLVIQARELSYTDSRGTSWEGAMPRQFGVPDDESVVEGVIELLVTDGDGQERTLVVQFRLCVEWASSIAIC